MSRIARSLDLGELQFEDLSGIDLVASVSANLVSGARHQPSEISTVSVKATFRPNSAGYSFKWRVFVDPRTLPTHHLEGPTIVVTVTKGIVMLDGVDFFVGNVLTRLDQVDISAHKHGNRFSMDFYGH